MNQENRLKFNLCNVFFVGKKKKQDKKDKYSAKHNAIFDSLELNTYEEVVRLPCKFFRNIIFITMRFEFCCHFFILRYVTALTTAE